jgi:polar amino acid transport system substrate-binding protein
MNLSQLRRIVPAAAITSLAAVSLAACGGSSSSSSTSSTTAVDSAAAALVPASFKGKTLIVASDASYAPMEFIGSDGKTVVGADAELAQAIAGKLGLTAQVQNAGFDGILAGISSGKYTVGMSSFTDNKEREKQVDFVTYLSAGSSFYTPAGKANIKTKADLCGHTVAVEKGTVQQTDVETQNKACPAGKKITLSVFPDQNGVNLALTSGRADVAIADTPVAAYAVKQSGGKLELSGDSYDSAPYGIAVKKGSGLDRAILAAVKGLVADGTYKQILDKWGLSAGAISDPKLNGAIS